MSSNLNLKYDKANISLRRNRTLELLAKGCQQYEISQILGVSTATTSLDCQYIRCQSQQDMGHHISETLPYHYKLAMQVFMDNIRRANDIIENNPDDKTKIQAMTMISSVYEKIMDLDMHGPTISTAVDRVKTLENSRWMLKEMEQSSLSLENKEEAEEEDPEE